MIENSVRERLAEAIRVQGREMKEVSLAAGLGETYVRDALKRGRGKWENIRRVAPVLGIDEEWLMKGHGTMISGAASGPNDLRNILNEIENVVDLEKNTFRNSFSRNRDGLLTAASGSRPPQLIERSDPPLYGPPLEVLGAVKGGDDGKLIFNGQPIERIPRPPILENVDGAYAAYVAGSSMRPRFKEGEKVWVHPHRPARPGDDVVVQVYPEHEGDAPEGYIKEFVRYAGSKLILYQHNPAEPFELDRVTVKSVHVIVGSLYA